MKYIKQSLLLLSLLLVISPVVAPVAVNAQTDSTQVKISAVKSVKKTVKKPVVKKKVVKKPVAKKKVVVNPWKAVRFNLPESFDADVTAIDGRSNQVSGKSKEGLMIIQMTPDTVIKRDGSVIAWTNIVVGDHLKVKGDGQVTQSAIVIAKTIDALAAQIPAVN